MVEMQRKLAAIMFTDIYQYSRLMSRDEVKAFELLTEHDRIVESVIEAHHGRVLKKMGDAFFVEFGASINALKCALAIQQALKGYNQDKKADERILVRIGLHEGDLIARGDDLFGEGVNVAARLEPLAEPGGICFSEALYKSVKTQIDIEPVFVGDMQLKNIIEKYTIYKIPSYLGDEFSGLAKPAAEAEPRYSYRIKTIKDIPVRYLAPRAMFFFAFVLYAISLLIMASISLDRLDGAYLLEFAKDNARFLILSFVVLAAAMVYFYAAKSVRVVFEDVRDVDQVLAFLTSQIGYQPPVRTTQGLIFKPSKYDFMMFSARRIRAQVDGFSVILSGNYMFMNKLLNMLKIFQDPR